MGILKMCHGTKEVEKHQSLVYHQAVHLVMGGRWRQQRNHGNHDSCEATEQDGEVKVVDAAQHGRSRVHHATPGGREGELQHHTAHAHHQAHHQTPEGPLEATHIHTHPGQAERLP